MEIVDGYLLMEQMLLLVACSQLAKLPLEQQLHNAKLGDQHAYQMEQHVNKNLHAHYTLLKLLVELVVQMVHASGLPQLE